LEAFKLFKPPGGAGVDRHRSQTSRLIFRKKERKTTKESKRAVEDRLSFGELLFLPGAGGSIFRSIRWQRARLAPDGRDRIAQEVARLYRGAGLKRCSRRHVRLQAPVGRRSMPWHQARHAVAVGLGARHLLKAYFDSIDWDRLLRRSGIITDCPGCCSTSSAGLSSGHGGTQSIWPRTAERRKEGLSSLNAKWLSADHRDWRSGFVA